MAGSDVKLVECPRDALQGLLQFVPTDLKVLLLRHLLAAGLRHLDCVSFVSPQAVPQMSDSEQVLADLGAPPAGTELIGIIFNPRGLERAATASFLTTVGFPLSVSPGFQFRNARQSPEQAMEVLSTLAVQARTSGLKLIVYISMAFGNPFGDPWSPERVLAALDSVAALGVREVSLADTVGLARAPEIAHLYALAAQRHPEMEIGLHLHSRPDLAPLKVRAAWQAGCRRFDTAAGGLGGCPFAGDHLVGNLPTESVVATLRQLGASVDVNDNGLSSAVRLVDQLRLQFAA